MKKITLVIALVVVGIGTFFISNSSKDEAVTSTLSGSVSYRERIALPAGSVIEVSLQDTSRADVAATVLASSTIVTTGENVPVPFSLTYDPSSIDSRYTYSIAARILVEGKLRWINQSSVPVLTNGAATSSVEVLVSAVGAPVVKPTAPVATTTPSAVNLDGTTFRLSSFKGANVPVGQNYLLTFDGNRLKAKFCNGVSGEYKIEKNIIKGNLISTQMYCGEPANIMTIESTFGSIIGTGAAYVINGSTLTLMGTRGDVLVFDVFMD